MISTNSLWHFFFGVVARFYPIVGIVFLTYEVTEWMFIDDTVMQDISEFGLGFLFVSFLIGKQ
jgi:hypothetical protein